MKTQQQSKIKQKVETKKVRKKIKTKEKTKKTKIKVSLNKAKHTPLVQNSEKEKKESKNTKKQKSISIQKEKKLKAKKYYEAVGRRKSAIARIRLYTCGPSESIENGGLVINGKKYKEFFKTLELQLIVESPFARLKSLNRFKATVRVRGGGIKGQAEAIRHGIARALVLFDKNFRKKLKKAGYLTRDSRVKERKKFGLKKARKGPQWSKR